MDDGNDSGVEIKLMKAQEVFVYKVPPLNTADGYRAELWNLKKDPLLTGVIEVFQKGQILILKISEVKTRNEGKIRKTEHKLFAVSAITITGRDYGELSRSMAKNVEKVIDSSRYFVIKLEMKKKTMTGRVETKKALMGIGFRERDTAFEFQGALDQHVKDLVKDHKVDEIHRMEAKNSQGNVVAAQETSATRADFDDEGASSDVKREPYVPSSEFALQEGKVLHLNLGGNAGTKTRTRPANTSKGGGSIFLKPPPSATPLQTSTETAPVATTADISAKMSALTTTTAPTNQGVSSKNDGSHGFDDDDFGDFVDAT